MRCNHCKAEWTVSEEIAKKLVNCPFCGQSLLPPKPVTPKTLCDALLLIIDRHGMDTLKDGYRTISLFLDLAPDLRREKTMLSYLIQVDGHIALLKGLQANSAQQAVTLGQTATRIVDNCLISQTLAEDICRNFWTAIGGQPTGQSASSVPETAKKTEPEFAPDKDDFCRKPSASPTALALYNEYQAIVNRQSVRNILSREIQDLEASKKKYQGQSSVLQDQLTGLQKQKSHLQSKIQGFQETIKQLSRGRPNSPIVQDHRTRLQEVQNELQTLKAKESSLKQQISADPLPIQTKHLIAQLDDQIRQKQARLNHMRKTDAADNHRMKTLRYELCESSVLRELAWQPEKAALLQKDPTIRSALIRMKP